MSIIENLKKLISKKQSSDLLGITFRLNSIDFCAVADPATNPDENDLTEIRCQQIKSDPSKYAETLGSLHQEQNLKGQCHVVLSAQQAQMVQVDKPNVPDDEINGALKWQVKDLVSFSADNMVVDYFDGPKLAGGSEKINVVCASKSDLKAFVEQLNKNDINVKSIITEEFAFASLLQTKGVASLLVCQQPNEEVIILIVKNGQLFFNRRLRGFAQISEKSEDELAMTVIDALSLEIQRSTDYYERQLKQAPIKSIEIILPLEAEPFIARKLAENTHIAVNLLKLPEQFRDQRPFAAAIGATLYADVLASSEEHV